MSSTSTARPNPAIGVIAVAVLAVAVGTAVVRDDDGGEPAASPTASESLDTGAPSDGDTGLPSVDVSEEPTTSEEPTATPSEQITVPDDTFVPDPTASGTPGEASPSDDATASETPSATPSEQATPSDDEDDDVLASDQLDETPQTGGGLAATLGGLLAIAATVLGRRRARQVS